MKENEMLASLEFLFGSIEQFVGFNPFKPINLTHELNVA